MIKAIYEPIVSLSITLLIVLMATIYYIDNCILWMILSAASLIIIGQYWRTIVIALNNLPKDISCVVRYSRYLNQLKAWESKGWTTADIFLDNVKKHPNKNAFIHEDSFWTFQQVEDFSNQIANYFKSQGFNRGDTIALLMESCPEFTCIWLGLSKIGVVSAFINTQQRQKLLLHSLRIIDCKAIIVADKLSEHVAEIVPSVSDLKVYLSGSNTSNIAIANSIDLDIELVKTSADPLPKDLAVSKMTDTLCYVYTSGTTGLPKAAIMTHCRFILMACGANKILRLTDNDILYEPLPFYHTAGGLLGAGQAVLCGITVVIKTKFSVSNFWKDCIKYNCTVCCTFTQKSSHLQLVQTELARQLEKLYSQLHLKIAHHLGEICRYLLAVPEKPEDHQHKVRLMFGNGLRAQIWEQFVKRFNVKQIGELYAATEGNANLMNAWNKPGAVGYLPWFITPFYPVALIQVDSETKEPIRSEDGFCIRCKSGEPGIIVGEISEKRVSSHFNGYTDIKASEKKIIHNVFRKGDKYFNSGDILVTDEYGYFYFRDRTGDTYRWRGENVATSEVEAVISDIIGLEDAAVYGVEVPNIEGKAGMVAVVDENQRLNLTEFHEEMKTRLPSYARPIFLRIIECIPMTGTFKLLKSRLQSEGYNPSTIKDSLYFLHPNEGRYITLTEDIYKDIINGKVRL